MKISKSSLNNGSELLFGDFNVFIGGNGVGKTTFLSELFSKSSAIPKSKYFWINEPTYLSDNVGTDMKLLKSSLSTQHEGTNIFYHSQAVKNFDGNVDLNNNLRFSSTEYEQIESKTETTIFSDVKYRRPFIVFSSCEARLSLPNDVAITGLDLPPQDPINVLYRNKKVLKKIDKTILEIFKLNFILLAHSTTKLYLGLSKENPPAFNLEAENLQDEYEKVQKWKDQNFIILSESGHGIRSMIRLLTSLLEPVNQIIMIDEPEMHLYPSQKRWLGKQMVNLAKNQKKQVFLVTHDPMVLQGILDANTKTKIFHIERDENGSGLIKSCELEKITDANAMKNQEQYLQGLFYQRCIVVEGASDRSFYQNIIEEYREISDKDLGFVACGGKGGTKHMASIISKVGLKAAFIYDFDIILFETKLIKEIYSLLGGTNDLLSKIDVLFNQQETIKTAKDNKERNKLIKDLCNYNERKGIEGEWVTKNKNIFDEVINLLSAVGIFIVPNGTLESWAPNVEPKVRFAEIAPEVIKGDEILNTQLKKFVQQVLGYLGIEVK